MWPTPAHDAAMAQARILRKPLALERAAPGLLHGNTCGRKDWGWDPAGELWERDQIWTVGNLTEVADCTGFDVFLL